jgi:hypothetical protein
VKTAAFLLAALCFAAGIASAWKYRALAGGIDFYQYWVVARVLERSQPFDVYDSSQSERIGALYQRESLQGGHSRRERQAARARARIEVYSTPFLYGAFGLFNTQSFETDLTRYELVCALSLALGFFGCCRAVGATWTRALLLAGITLLWFEPYRSDARVSNVNQLQLGLIGLFLWLRKEPLAPARALASGSALGFALLLKPNLVWAAALLFLDGFLQRRFAALLWTAFGAAAAIAVGVALGSLSFGSLGAWPRWVDALQRLLGESQAAYTVEVGNYAFAPALREWTGLALRSSHLAVAGLLATIACLWMGRGSAARAGAIGDGPTREALLLGAGAFIVLLGSRLYWLHYAILLLPMAIALLRPAQAAERAPRIRLALGAAGFLLLAAQPPIRVLSAFATPSAGHYAALVIAGASLLFGAALWQLAQRSTDARIDPAPA